MNYFLTFKTTKFILFLFYTQSFVKIIFKILLFIFKYYVKHKNLYDHIPGVNYLIN